ncbi:MAG: methyl-accepting chemotaxis protein [Pseudomonadota bacterium]
MRIANIKIGHRLTIAFSLTIVLLAVVVAVGATRLTAVGNEIDVTINDRYQKISLLNQNKDAMNRQAASLRNALLMSDPAAVRGEIAQVGQTGQEADAALEKLGNMPQATQARSLLDAIHAARSAYGASRERLLAQLGAGDKTAAADFMQQRVRADQQAYFDAVEALVDYQVKLMHASGRSAQETASTASLIMVLLGVAGGVLSLVTAWFITRGIVGPIEHAVRVARTVAGGDLSSAITVHSSDEVGQLSQALKDMNDSLVKIVGQVRSGTDTIAGASAEIASGNADLSLRTEQQAGSLEETAASIEQLTSTVKQNTDSARLANELAQSASDVAGKGGAAVAQVVETMASINASSSRIADIIGVIDGIAFQTNILALNAAVEAARAGEQGRGFAVVANEVRNLAQRSAAAAREIKGLIGASVEQVETGARLVDQAGATMHDIVASVRRVTDIIGEIASASQEQLSGIEQINAAIGAMDQTTRQNAVLVEQASAAAGAMREQALSLSGTVGVFTLAAGSAPVQQASVSRMPSTRRASAERLPAVIPAQQGRKVANGVDDAWQTF